MENKYKHLNELQQAGLNILKVLIGICKRHELTYYVYGGTLLGAVRHKGFIPWDDDVDVAMPRKDFEKLKQYVNELPCYMFLDTIQRKGHQWTAAHVVDNRFLLEVGKGQKKARIPVWVDILIIDGVPTPGTFKYKMFGSLYLVARLLYKFSNFSHEVDLEKKRPLHEAFFISFAKLTRIERIVNQHWAGCFLDWVSRRYDLDKCEYGATLGGPQKMDETQPKSWFGKGKEMQFEDIVVITMDKAVNFLIKFYGPNYMTPPPVDKRNQHNVKLISSNGNE
jgi:lipopolysaccharide cholinephosphotransferase